MISFETDSHSRVLNRNRETSKEMAMKGLDTGIHGKSISRWISRGEFDDDRLSRAVRFYLPEMAAGAAAYKL